jgi:hypothetical protein
LGLVPLFGLRFAVFFSLRHVWIPPTFHVSSRFASSNAFASLSASRVNR